MRERTSNEGNIVGWLVGCSRCMPVDEEGGRRCWFVVGLVDR